MLLTCLDEPVDGFSRLHKLPLVFISELYEKVFFGTNICWNKIKSELSSMSWMSAGNYIEATSLNEPMPFSRSHLEPRKHPPSLSLSFSPLSRPHLHQATPQHRIFFLQSSRRRTKSLFSHLKTPQRTRDGSRHTFIARPSHTRAQGTRTSRWVLSHTAFQWSWLSDEVLMPS